MDQDLPPVGAWTPVGDEEISCGIESTLREVLLHLEKLDLGQDRILKVLQDLSKGQSRLASSVQGAQGGRNSESQRTPRGGAGGVTFAPGVRTSSSGVGTHLQNRINWRKSGIYAPQAAVCRPPCEAEEETSKAEYDSPKARFAATVAHVREEGDQASTLRAQNRFFEKSRSETTFFDDGGFADGSDEVSATESSDTPNLDAEDQRESNLPPGWPGAIVIRTELVDIKDVEEGAVIKAITRSKVSVNPQKPSQMSRVDSSTKERIREALGLSCADEKEGLNPHSVPMMLFQFFVMLILLYDMVTTPFIVAWGVEVDGVLAAMTIVSSLTWTIDLALCFVTGYSDRGELVMDRPRVMRRYLKTWFAYDGVLNATDWLIVGLQSYEGKKVTALLRIFRVVKVLKLLRAGKIMVFRDAIGMILWRSELRRLMLKVVEVLLFTFLISHIAACGWFAMGLHYADSSGETWLDHAAYLTIPGTYHKAVQVDQYLTALHFTVAQLTLGASDVMPANSLERTFNIILLVGGLLFGCTVVSLFSAQIVQLMMSKLEKGTKMNEMRQYLRQHCVSHQLSVQVMAQATERLRDKEILRAEDVSILPYLSKMLRHQLMYETSLPHLMVHPLFSSWNAIDQESVLRLCREAVLSDFVASLMEVFLPGTEAPFCFYIVKGRFLYTQPVDYSMKAEATQDVVLPGTWLSEAALWSHWIHVGALSAQTMGHIISISAEALWQVMKHHVEVATVTADYCRSFHVRIGAAVPPHAPWPNDLEVPFTHPRDLLASHVDVGLLHRAVMKGKLTLTHPQVDALKAELREEKCGLDPHPDGSFKRIVYVEAVRVESLSGLIFTEVGTWESTKGTKAGCRYPAKKRGRGELPQTVLKRLFETELGPLSNLVSFTKQEEEVEETRSPKFGIPTTYNRTVHIATLQVDPDKLEVHRMVVTQDVRVPDTIKNIVPQELFFLPDGQMEKIYAWLPYDAFKTLRNPSHHEPFTSWLSTVTSNTIRHVNV
uniref:Ion transport domain-containing protein n=1 Tax=Alexandrium monilatum TaxID=311494 RepID=A0A7S4R8W6_9DINO